MASMSALLKFLKKSEEYGTGAANDIAKIFAKSSKSANAGAPEAAKLSRTSAKLIEDLKSGKIPDHLMQGPPKPGMGSRSYDKIIRGYEENPKTAAALLGGAGLAGAGGAGYAMSGDDKKKKRRRTYED